MALLPPFSHQHVTSSPPPADTFAYYYYRRGRWQAAVDATVKAYRAHKALAQWDHVAKCRMHTAMLLSKRRRHLDAIKMLKGVTKMLEQGKLEVGGVNAMKLCLMTLLYHNLAVEYVLVNEIQQAVSASQASRRLANLCVSYASKYRTHMEATHKEILGRLLRTDQIKGAIDGMEHKAAFAALSKDYFSNY